MVLVALSLRMFQQERELAEKRLVEEQRRLTNEIRQQLLGQLERIKLQEVSRLATATRQDADLKPENPAVVFVGRVEHDRLVLPWEMRLAETAKLLREPAFAQKIHDGEAAELVAREPGKAMNLYREALEAARHPVQAAQARLLLIRSLAKLNRARDAAENARKLLALPFDLTDEHGVPYALYAAGWLVEAGTEHTAVLERVRAAGDSTILLAPAAVYLLRDVASRLDAQEVGRKAGEQIRRLEQALALQNEFPNLLAMQRTGLRSSEPVWLPFGDDLWLAGFAPQLGGMPEAVVAVHAATLSASLDAPGGARLFAGGEKGEPLGANFPGLRVVFSEKSTAAFATQGSQQRYFYVAVLVLVLGVTLFGAYLLWRDIRRELQMADLRSQFVSSVSHELKTPLTAIRMFAETLRLERAADPHAQAEYLETIVSESERLTRLLNNVLDFSKIEQGTKIYRPELTALPEVIEATVRAMQYALGQQGFRLRVNIENDLPPVRADRDALEQAVLNLLTNAVKYSGESREVDLRLHRGDGHAVIQVTDRGVGIPLEEQSRIFEKFYRVRTPENLLIPGTGLGLTLVEHIAKAHGWRVQVESAPGQGSTFSLRIPLEAGT